MNDYIKKLNSNRHAGNKLKQEIENGIIWELKRQGIRETVTQPVKVKLTWYEHTRRRDKDNVRTAVKFILDALQKAGTLPNDNNKYITGFTDEYVYKQGDGVTVELIPDNQTKATADKLTDKTEQGAVYLVNIDETQKNGLIVAQRGAMQINETYSELIKALEKLYNYEHNERT